MRLLRYTNSGEFGLTKDLVGDDTIHPYAILSHTWLADTEEPTFEDLTNGIGKNKPGYEKIRFCWEQARQDGLEYFWIDTCCINKANQAELSQAINSMFRWYRNATRCYVYLSDVRSPSFGTRDEIRSWDSDFWKCKWFTRGWTLQELLAPRSVEFFSDEGKRLGDKISLKQQIHEITGIPESVLNGDPLSQFSVNERMSWINPRQTKLEEDKAYSLLGIFDVKILLIYGEGAVNAFKRLQEVIDKREKCIQDLRLTDPRDDKKRIEDFKGGLLEDSYRWILENPEFQQWRSAQQNPLLWIRGDPGKGKTMLLCGIINELNKSKDETALLSYFFCQATDSRINNATAVLRGLIYLFIDQQPSLVSHVQRKYDQAGKTLFEDANAWVALSEIFTNILQDPSLNPTYLIIDALDECVTDLPKLLDFVVRKSAEFPRVKWIVSSRNWPEIGDRLERAGRKLTLWLELNPKSISTAVSTYIQHKVNHLAQQNGYDLEMRQIVFDYLSLHAKDTFLWVALVCQDLENVRKRNIKKKLAAYPPGLGSLYEKMMEKTLSSDDADHCKQVLATITLVYQPITLKELTSLIEMADISIDDLKEIVLLCGSFLTLREGTGTIYFVHQSAKDFLFKDASDQIFPSGEGEVHYQIFSRSLQAMSTTLQRDMYSLGALGYPIKEVNQPKPDPLAASRYSCIYWVDHFCDWNSHSHTNQGFYLQDGGIIEDFLRKKYLYWLEALSLCRSMSDGIISMEKLEALLQRRADASALTELVRDARRFIMYHKLAIENSPLQVYASALIFSPASSLIKVLFKHEEPKWIMIEPPMRDEWSACLQTLEGHSGWVWSVAFSHDSTRLASASHDTTIKIWDASSGKCLHTLKGHGNPVSSVAFTHDSTRLASASYDKTVKIWDTSSGKCIQTLEGHRHWVGS
ncbi:hypothetical protein K432DRAFT_252461, partial [Lepidopterella palustris CBS 459.81]